VPFTLPGGEFTLSKSGPACIPPGIPQQPGPRGTSAALARTVLPRRPASSVGAIHQSLQRRRKKQQDRLEELAGRAPLPAGVAADGRRPAKSTSLRWHNCLVSRR
jgi:hypothetical protein